MSYRVIICVTIPPFVFYHELYILLGNMWKKALIDITSKEDYQLSIEAIAGPSFAGDIAIDDVEVAPGLCPEELGCDFEGSLFCFTLFRFSYQPLAVLVSLVINL